MESSDLCGGQRDGKKIKLMLTKKDTGNLYQLRKQFKWKN